jgi:hypothetical protein
MSYQITITEKQNYILLELVGEIPIQKIFALNSYLYNDPDFQAHPFAIWDISVCTIDTELDTILQYAKQLGQKRNFSTPGKTAFIVTNQHLQEMAPPFIELVDELSFQFETFDNRLAAVQWITKNQ